MRLMAFDGSRWRGASIVWPDCFFLAVPSKHPRSDPRSDAHLRAVILSSRTPRAANPAAKLTPVWLGSRKRRLHLLRYKRYRAQPRARRVEHGVRDGGGDGASHRLTRPPRDRPRTIDERDLDLRRLSVAHDWVARPVDARHLVAVPRH